MHPDILYAEVHEAQFCIEWVAEAESVIRSNARLAPRPVEDAQDAEYLRLARVNLQRVYDATERC